MATVKNNENEASEASSVFIHSIKNFQAFLPYYNLHVKMLDIRSTFAYKQQMMEKPRLGHSFIR